MFFVFCFVFVFFWLYGITAFFDSNDNKLPHSFNFKQRVARISLTFKSFGLIVTLLQAPFKLSFFFSKLEFYYLRGFIFYQYQYPTFYKQNPTAIHFSLQPNRTYSVFKSRLLFLRFVHALKY